MPKLSTEEFIQRSNIIHNFKYDYSKSSYKGLNFKIDIICPTHGIFTMTANNHINKKCGCKKCKKVTYNKTTSAVPLLSNEEFLQRSKQNHNNMYDYSKTIYTSYTKKIIVTCPIHGDFYVHAGQHSNGYSGCHKCVKETNNKIYIDTIIDKAHNIHNFKYNYSKTVFSNLNKDKVIIICPNHGEFITTMNNHINNHVGCLKCKTIKLDNTVIENQYIATETNHLVFKKHNYVKDNQTFINKAVYKHGDKYDYSFIKYTGTYIPVIIMCKIHGPFLQKPNIHLSGSGCQKCKTSKGENFILKYFCDNNIKYIHQHKFNDCIHNTKLVFDFYLPDHNLLIEYDGEQHFISKDFFGGEEGLKYNKLRDSIKTKYAEDNNIKLIRFRYDDSLEFIRDELSKLEIL